MSRSMLCLVVTLALALPGPSHARGPRAPTQVPELSRRLNLLERQVKRGGMFASGFRDGSMRRELASIGRCIRRMSHSRAGVSPRLNDRWRRLVSVAQYRRRTTDPRRRASTTTATENETPLTAGLVGLIEPRGSQRVGPLLDRVRPHVRAGAARPELMRQKRRAWAEGLLKDAPSGRRAMLGPVQHEADLTLRRMDAEDGLVRAMQGLRGLARDKGVEIKDLTWQEVGERLGPAVQRDLIVAAAAKPGPLRNFHDNAALVEKVYLRDRSLPFLRVSNAKRRAQTRRREPSFLDRVELMSPEDGIGLRRVEVHTRDTGRAGRHSTRAFHKLWRLGSSMHWMHVHIPFRVGRHRGDRRPGASVFFADHWRRANLYGELLTLLREGEIKCIAKGERMREFDYSSGDQVAQLNSHLRGVAPLSRETRDALKMTAVGYRVQIYRDRSGRRLRGVEGYEVRDVDAKPRGETRRDRLRREGWLDAIQRSLYTGHYGINPSSLKGWYRRNVPGGSVAAETDLLNNLHYRHFLSRGGKYVEERGRPVLEVADHVMGAMGRRVGARLPDLIERNYGVAMLVHDWSKDTVWLDVPRGERRAALARIQKAQRRGLGQLERGVDSKRVMREFVTRTHLLGYTARSLGVHDLLGRRARPAGLRVSPRSCAPPRGRRPRAGGTREQDLKREHDLMMQGDLRVVPRAVLLSSINDTGIETRPIDEAHAELSVLFMAADHSGQPTQIIFNGFNGAGLMTRSGQTWQGTESSDALGHYPLRTVMDRRGALHSVHPTDGIHYVAYDGNRWSKELVDGSKRARSWAHTKEEAISVDHRGRVHLAYTLSTAATRDEAFADDTPLELMYAVRSLAGI